VEKYFTAGKAEDDNMAHAHCMLDAYGYTHTNTRSDYDERTSMLHT